MGVETVREILSEAPTSEYLESRSKQGWRCVAIEWERPGDESRPSVLKRTEVPYGLRVSGDGLHLEENPDEVETMTRMLELIVEDRSLGAVAASLNQEGRSNRRGRKWTQTAVFQLLPRLVAVAPDLFATEEWSRGRQKRLEEVAATA